MCKSKRGGVYQSKAGLLQDSLNLNIFNNVFSISFYKFKDNDSEKRLLGEYNKYSSL